MCLNENVKEALWALREKPIYATSVERVLIFDEIKSDYKHLSQPRRFGAMLSAFLDRVSTPLEPYDLIAGRCVDRELTEEEEARFQAFLQHPDYPRKDVFFSAGHCSLDWDMLVREGLCGLRRRAADALSQQVDEDKKQFLMGMIEIYDAISNYLLRYAKAAEEKGMTALAANLKKCATAAPDDFYSALQLHWTVALIDCAYITPNPTLTLGRMDQFLYPYYAADIAAGKLTRERAADLITDYYCKHNLIMGRGEHQVGTAENSTTFERIFNFDAPQYLLLAGVNEKGDDLTYLMVECILPGFKNPVAVVRYTPGLNERHPELWQTLCARSLSSASLMYYNDDNVRRTYRRIGIPEEDIYNYIHFGCNWSSLGTKASWMQGGPSAKKYNAFLSPEEEKSIKLPCMRYNRRGGWPVRVTDFLTELCDKEDLTMEDLYEKFLSVWGDFADEKLQNLARELEVRQRRPAAVLTYVDCFNDMSLRTVSCHSAGAKYHFEMHSFYMFGSTVDCFVVVDELVFRRKLITLRELLEATRADFKGYEHILALCRSVPKYGSDSALSNAHAKRLVTETAAVTVAKSRPYLEKYGLYLNLALQSDTWHLKTGIQVEATVNGRRANTPFSQNSRPANGSCINGTTGMLNAMLNVPADCALSGALNLDVDPRQFPGEEGRRLFSTVLATYLNNGGLHAQVTTVKLEDLIDAQKNPDAHRDLLVRVTGYSGVFVDICKDLQDDIIERLK